jgi:hypothetical protein
VPAARGHAHRTPRAGLRPARRALICRAASGPADHQLSAGGY